MRKMNLLIVIMLTVFTANACGNYGANSSLKLKLWNNSSFKVVLDGQQFPKTSLFNMNQLTTGIHNIQIVKVIKPYHGNGGLKQILYSGKIRIPNNTKVIATVTPNRRLELKTVMNGRHYNSSCTNGSQSYNNCNIYSGDYKEIMNGASFSNLLQMVNNTSFDSSKLNIVKQVLKHNHLNSEQVLLLSSQFTFDSSRLKFAKLAYHKTVDKQNYFMINETFTFNSSVSNLYNYINQFG